MPELRIKLSAASSPNAQQVDFSCNISSTETRWSWMAPEHRVSATSACQTAAVRGFVAPFGSITEVHQLLSVNGWPTHNTILHDLILRVHTSMRAGQRRRPNSFMEAAQPAYTLHVTVPKDWVTFSGPTLMRTADFSGARLLEGLIAQALHTVWRQHMPAVLLKAIKARMISTEGMPNPSIQLASQEQPLQLLPDCQTVLKHGVHRGISKHHCNRGAMLQQVSGHLKHTSHSDTQDADCERQQVL
jgi:hypothetical protein